LRFAISGASGLIGRALTACLRGDGHDVTVLVRRTAPHVPGDPNPDDRNPDDQNPDKQVVWDPEAGRLDTAALDGCRIFVNLSGAPIGDRRWSEGRKEELLRSRVRPTALLARAAAELAPVDGVLLSASAVGWYGDRGNEELTEQSSPGTGVLPELCRRWEEATSEADEAGVRVVHLRSGVVLTRDGGALKKQLPLFRLGLGGRLGSGRQWVSWISLIDEIGAIRHAAAKTELRGPVNVVAPQPVTNAELTRGLARGVHRPALLRVPRPVLKAAFGSGLAGGLMLTSQRVLPARLLETGYRFTTPDLDSALAQVLARPT
jgi:uncharacterized protein (TIGR01777 family)